MIDTYDAEVRRTDGLLEDFVESTQTDSTFDDPVYILSADHGEAFGEHGWMGHPPESLYDESLWIPLLLYDPESEDHGRDGTVVSSLDIGPTICEIAGSEPPTSFRGKSLLDTSEWDREGVYSLASHESRWVLSREKLGIRYRTSDWSYIYRESADDELYRPGESENMMEAYPDRSRALRDEIDPVLAEIKFPDECNLAVSQENKDRLRDLGYIVE